MSELDADHAAAIGGRRVGRRGWLTAASVGSASMGVGLAWWYLGVRQSATDRELLEEFWASEWQTPDARRLAASEMRGHPLLLNFWATWCTPCIAELPLLDHFFRENHPKGWQMLAIAIDNLVPVQTFLSKNAYEFPVVMGAAGGITLARKLGNLSGGLPFSVLISANGGVAYRKMGALTESDLQALRRSV